jgi:hypothetical protein
MNAFTELSTKFNVRQPVFFATSKKQYSSSTKVLIDETKCVVALHRYMCGLQ